MLYSIYIFEEKNNSCESFYNFLKTFLIVAGFSVFTGISLQYHTFLLNINLPKAWHDNIDVLPSITVDRGEGCAVNLGACNCGDSEKNKNGKY